MASVYYDAPRLPIIDIGWLDESERWRAYVAQQLDWACSEFGFFYIVGHGISSALVDRLLRSSRQFFDQDLETKLKIHMSRGGRAWRGYFPVGEELTSGVPDLKEGVYFGAEPAEGDPQGASELPLHGRNLFPDIPDFRETVLEYLAALTGLGHRLIGLVTDALGCAREQLAGRYTDRPTILLRIFNYPPDTATAGSPEQTVAGTEAAPRWGVGEHTDYGLLTILKQDAIGGLQISHKERWVDVPDVPGSFVCNVGDVLETLTRGRYRSAPHRVKNASASSRISVPFFFDPSFDAELVPLPLAEESVPGTPREIRGTYGEYLISKVARVFPDLRRRVLD